MRSSSPATSASTGTSTAAGDEEIRSEDQLFAPFRAAFENKGHHIGLEAEKFGVHADGSPLRYAERHGIPAIFDELIAKFGWLPDSESPGSPTIALHRGRASITLEPGSQLELSGAPMDDVHAVAAEVETHKRELAALESARDVRWLGLGFHPFAHQHDLDWVPKARYVTMREYLPTRGSMAIDMMRRTATVQANFDISSERDAMRKLRVALAISPVVQAIFANSAVYENVRHPIKSHRAEVWLNVDPDRSGMLPFAWRDDAALGDYVRWALGVPMFIVKRDGRVIPNTHQTFGDFLRHGRDGYRATLSDWEMHLNTLFPEVRLKRTLEVRCADGVPSMFGNALPALWTGILYDDAALEAAGDRVLPIGYDAWHAARPHIAAQGLKTYVRGRSLQELALAIVDIASHTLALRARRNANGQDERVFLEPLEAILRDGLCVGDAVLADWSPTQPHAQDVLCERARY